MKAYCVVQHTYSEFLGIIERQLEKRDIGFGYFRPFIGQALPANALQFDALFLLAGAFPVADDEACPWLADELRAVKAFHNADRPILGLGFGAHVLALHHGGQGHEEPEHTAHFTTAHKTAAGEGDAVAEVMDGRTVFVMHNGDVTLPESVAPILVDDDGNWLAIRPVPMHYGLLFRPEMKPGMLEDMIMEANRPVPEHIGELLIEARRRWEDLQATTDQLLVALVKELDLMRERRKPPVFSLKPSQD